MRNDDDAIFDALEAPFEPREVKQREGDRGRMLSYIDAPTAKRRLDQVVGRANWECDVAPCEGGVKCRITIRLPDGREISRAALGGYAPMKSPEDAFKSGDTDAFKRACARFGIGAYLGEDNHPAAGRAPAPGRQPQQPPPPHRGRPRGQWGGGDKPRADPPQRRDGSDRRPGRPPLYGRLRDAEAQHPNGAGLVDHMAAWGQRKGFPPRINDWTGDQIKAAEVEARNYLNPEPVHAE